MVQPHDEIPFINKNNKLPIDTTIFMDLTGTILSERIQSQKVTTSKVACYENLFIYTE